MCYVWFGVVCCSAEGSGVVCCFKGEVMALLFTLFVLFVSVVCWLEVCVCVCVCVGSGVCVLEWVCCEVGWVGSGLVLVPLCVVGERMGLRQAGRREKGKSGLGFVEKCFCVG